MLAPPGGQEAIPGNIASRIGTALNEKTLTADICRPRLAIFKAIRADDLEAVRAELAGGQDPDGVNENGTSALAAAVSGKQLEIVRVLLDAGAKADGPNNGFPLLASALPDGKDTRPPAERYALADMLIAAGAPVDASDSNGTPLLMRRISYYSEDRDNLSYLLDKGANPNAREKNGRSLLHAALQSPKKFWFADKLLAKGADINAAYIRMYYGNSAMWETPLLEALRESISGEFTPTVVYPIPERVTYALAHGADPAVGGYGAGKALERNGLNEALSLAVRYLQPTLVDQLAQAAGKPQVPLTPDALSSLLKVWNQLEIRASVNHNSPEWDGQRARLRATADRLLAAGVPLAHAADLTGLNNKPPRPAWRCRGCPTTCTRPGCRRGRGRLRPDRPRHPYRRRRGCRCAAAGDDVAAGQGSQGQDAAGARRRPVPQPVALRNGRGGHAGLAAGQQRSGQPDGRARGEAGAGRRSPARPAAT